MTETEQLDDALTRELRCQAILATTSARCPRAATRRLHIRCATPGCHDERMFLCTTCANLVGFHHAACITCGELPIVEGAA